MLAAGLVAACTGGGGTNSTLSEHHEGLVGTWAWLADPSREMVLEAGGIGTKDSLCSAQGNEGEAARDCRDISQQALSWSTGEGAVVELRTEGQARQWTYALEDSRLVLADDDEVQVFLLAAADAPDLGHALTGVWTDLHGEQEYVFHAAGIGMRTVGTTAQLFTWTIGADNLLRLHSDDFGVELWTYTVDSPKLTLNNRQVPGLARTLIASRMP